MTNSTDKAWNRIIKKQNDDARQNVSRYWEIQLADAKKTLAGVKARVDAEPSNPWYRTWLESVENRIAECEKNIAGCRA